MPECPKCHEYYFGNPVYCPKCNFHFVTKPSSERTVYNDLNKNDDIKSGYSQDKTIKVNPHSRTCHQAESLDKWGGYFFAFSIIMAIITALAGGFQATIDSYGDITSKYAFGAMFSVGTIIGVLSWIGGGYAFRLIFEAFAVIVEASYRSMIKD